MRCPSVCLVIFMVFALACSPSGSPEAQVADPQPPYAPKEVRLEPADLPVVSKRQFEVGVTPAYRAYFGDETAFCDAAARPGDGRVTPYSVREAMKTREGDATLGVDGMVRTMLCQLYFGHTTEARLSAYELLATADLAEIIPVFDHGKDADGELSDVANPYQVELDIQGIRRLGIMTLVDANDNADTPAIIANAARLDDRSTIILHGVPDVLSPASVGYSSDVLAGYWINRLNRWNIFIKEDELERDAMIVLSDD